MRAIIIPCQQGKEISFCPEGWSSPSIRYPSSSSSRKISFSSSYLCVCSRIKVFLSDPTNHWSAKGRYHMGHWVYDGHHNGIKKPQKSLCALLLFKPSKKRVTAQRRNERTTSQSSFSWSSLLSSSFFFSWGASAAAAVVVINDESFASGPMKIIITLERTVHKKEEEEDAR